MRPAIRSLVTRSEIGVAANVVQHSTLRISRLVLDSPALILLRHGTKTLQAGGRQWRLQGGDAIVVAGGQTFDVCNQLSAQGLFEARWLLWDKALIAGFAHSNPDARPLAQASVLKNIDAEFAASVDRAVDAISDVPRIPAAIAKHRLSETLVWLAQRNVVLAPPRDATLAARLRQLFAGAMAQSWTASLVATRLGMSEATLRRKLAAEGATFGALLTDARMSFAMTLLQSTDQAVSRVASTVGYASAARFAVRFRARFGFAPTAIRGHHRSPSGPLDVTE